MSDITESDLNYMKSSIGLFPAISKEPIWLRAFAFYNEKNRRDGQMGMLSVSCGPCYIKVYLYCKNYIE